MDLIFHDVPLERLSVSELAIVEELAGGGDIFAQRILGDLFDDGDDNDKAMACQWYHIAACNGCRFSQYKLGVMYLEGVGVGENCYKALLWLMRARHGYMESCVMERSVCCPQSFCHIVLDSMRLVSVENESHIRFALKIMCEKGLEMRDMYAPSGEYYCSANIYQTAISDSVN